MSLQFFRRIVFHSTKNPYIPKFSLYCTSIKKQKTNVTDQVRDLLLHKHHFSQDTLSKIQSSVWNRTKNVENPDSVLMYLKENGLSQTQLEKAVKSEPRLLVARLEKTIKPKIKKFQDLGFSPIEIAVIISHNPKTLLRSVDNVIAPALLALRNLLGSSFQVTQLFKTSWSFWNWNFEKNVIPNIKFLNKCGVEMEQIKQQIYNFPFIFTRGLEDMKRYVKKAEEMGICGSSRMFIYSVRIIASLSDENWELKLKCFRNMGFSDDDISKMFIKAPHVFGFSTGKLEEVKEALIVTGKYDISSIVGMPIVFACSLEKKLNPRMRVLGILESKNLIKRWPSLGSITQMTECNFAKKYVQPHLNEVGQVYMANEKKK